MSGHIALIRLPWPEPALWQNRRKHWAETAEAIRKARAFSFAVAKEQSVGRLKTQTPTLRFWFHPPDKRSRDLHNLPATQKAAIDGISDAMGCDDKGFRCIWPTEFSEPVKGGCVMVEVTE